MDIIGLDSPEYKTIALRDLHQLMLMPTTYLSEKLFSWNSGLRTKK